MSYKTCLEKAGANVLDYKEFGSYQGDWLAFVEYMGQKGIVTGSYGSCSGCDAFEAEFRFKNSEPEEYEGRYYKNGYIWDEDNECSVEEFEISKQEYDNKLAEFGRRYLESNGSADLYDKSHYEKRLLQLDPEDWFDNEEKEQIEWALNRQW